MGRRRVSTTVCIVGAALLSSSFANATTINDDSPPIVDGGLRRKRLFNHQYKSETKQQATLEPPRQQEEGEMVPSLSNIYRAGDIANNQDVGDELAHKFFLSPTHKTLDDIDITQLIMEMNFEGGSMSFIQTLAPTPPPTVSPTQSPSTSPTNSPTKNPTISPTYSTYAPSTSTAPTLTSCDNEGTCPNRLAQIIFQVSEKVGSVETLQDPTSPQSKAAEWILKECEAEVPIDPCTPSQLEYNEQRYALAVLYFSLTGDGWNAGSNSNLDPSAPAGTWMSGLDYCEWGTEISGANGSYNQLVCNEEGYVINLNLQSNNLIGSIPPEIGVLSYLTSYISFTNAQSGEIPSTLGLITPLETFDVEFNNMDGTLFQGEYMNSLTNLINWRTSNNNFVGSIPSEIGLWAKLQNLWFSDNVITGSIPSEIGQLVDMDVLLGYKNQITGSIPSDIGNLDKMTWIDIEDNQLNGVIPEEFYTNVELVEVILRNNTLTGTISDSVSTLTKMTTFWVSNNELTGAIPTTFGELLSLDSLELQNNKLSGTIPEELGSMSAIEILALDQNDLTGTIPSNLFGFSLSKLKILYLNDNQLTGTLPENLGGSPRLDSLKLNDNLLTGTLPIISEGEFLFLKELLINNNDLTGVVDESYCLVRNNTEPGGNLGIFNANCGGDEPQIQCSCCTECFE